MLDEAVKSSTKMLSFTGDCRVRTVLQNSSARWAVRMSSKANRERSLLSSGCTCGESLVAHSTSKRSTSSVPSKRSLQNFLSSVGDGGRSDEECNDCALHCEKHVAHQ